jgi:hypothetical protein
MLLNNQRPGGVATNIKARRILQLIAQFYVILSQVRLQFIVSAVIVIVIVIVVVVVVVVASISTQHRSSDI